MAKYRKLKLSNGEYALVDAEDYDYLNQWKWSKTNKGYARRNGYEKGAKHGEGKRKNYCMHRVIMKAKDGEVLDHKNRNPLDNRKSNLRFCTRSQNEANKPGRNKTGYKGVYESGRPKAPWYSQIKVNGKRKHLGHFKTPQLAAEAYKQAALETWGEFSRT